MSKTRTPLLLLPGLLCTPALWCHQLDNLDAVAEMRVADLTRHDNMAELAAAALAEAPERFALAGLSMGGYVAFEILRQAPERVTRLALLDTSPHPDAPAQTRRRRDLLALAERGEFKGVTPRLLPLLIHEERLSDTALADVVTGMAEAVGKDAFLRQQTAIMNRPDSRPLLPRIHVPTLVLCGREDALTPLAVHREMAGAIPDAQLVVVEKCGHLAPLERPEAVTSTLRAWLKAAPGSAAAG